LTYIQQTPQLSLPEKQTFYRSVSRHFGSTALCLSGGASLGYYHFGVIKALLDANELPRVISGTSAGALVAALVCCRTEEEVKVLLVPELATKLTALEDDFKTWSKRMWKTGSRFDAVQWAKKSMWFTLVRLSLMISIRHPKSCFQGSMTFKEAYERTGRCV